MIGPRHRLNRNTKPLRATGVQSSNSPIPSSPPLIHNRRYRQFRRTLGSRSLNSSSQAPKSRGKDLARARRGRHWPPDRHCRERLRRERERIETRGIETRTGSSHLCFRSARGDASVAMGMEPIGPAAGAAPVGLTLCYNCPEGTAEAGCQGVLPLAQAARFGCFTASPSPALAAPGLLLLLRWREEEVAGCCWVGLGVLLPFSVPSRSRCCTCPLFDSLPCACTELPRFASFLFSLTPYIYI
jgi:hypothetical protein